MNRLDIVTALTLVSGYDRFVDATAEPTQAAWLYMLSPYTPEEVNEAIVKFFETPNQRPIQPANIVELIKRAKRLLPDQIAEDVRAAKARKLIAPSWPPNEQLPEQIAARLTSIRRGETIDAIEYDPTIKTNALGIEPDMKTPEAVA